MANPRLLRTERNSAALEFRGASESQHAVRTAGTVCCADELVTVFRVELELTQTYEEGSMITAVCLLETTLTKTCRLM